MLIMGRPREFDEHEVLQRAKELFWRRGYERTSVRDLVDELGIGRGSLYAAFGDKHALFVRALDDYVDVDQRALLLILDGDGPVLPQLRQVLYAVAAAARDQPGRGCLLVNSTTECAAHDPAAAECARRAFDRMETAFAQALQRAQRQDEIAKTIDPAAAAALLLTVLNGLQVVGKVRPDPQRLALAIDAAFDGLTATTPGGRS